MKVVSRAVQFATLKQIQLRPSLAKLHPLIKPLPGHPWPGVQCRAKLRFASATLHPSAPPMKVVSRAVLRLL
jgi:hypothetical protein